MFGTPVYAFRCAFDTSTRVAKEGEELSSWDELSSCGHHLQGLTLETGLVIFFVTVVRTHDHVIFWIYCEFSHAGGRVRARP